MGRWDDHLPVKRDGNQISVENKQYRSSMKTVSDAKIRLTTGSIQANHHLYAPLADYPMYTTEMVLEPGEYTFASVFAMEKLEKEPMQLPDLRLVPGGVEIILGNTYKFYELNCVFDADTVK